MPKQDPNDLKTGADLAQQQQAGDPPSQEQADQLQADQLANAEKKDVRFSETKGQDQVTSYQRVAPPVSSDRAVVQSTMVLRVKNEFQVIPAEGADAGRQYYPGQYLTQDDVDFLTEQGQLQPRQANAFIETVPQETDESAPVKTLAQTQGA